MSRTALEFPKAGESKLYGYAGSMVAFTIENQLLDAEKWALFVEQFRLKPDGENQGWRGEYWGKQEIQLLYDLPYIQNLKTSNSQTQRVE